MMRFIVTLVAAAFVLISQANSQQLRLIDEEAQKAASGALATFGQLVTEDNYRAMGFDSLGEVGVARLAEPLRVFMVRLDHLQKYEPGSDPNKMLSGGDQVIYPVTVGEQVRSSITVHKVERTWKAFDFGSPTLVKMLAKVRKYSADSTKLAISSYFVVRVPALNLYFIGHRADGVLMLTPLVDHPGYRFKARVTMPADRVFAALLPAAKGHDGLPR